jgi:pimeloyl-ACP methyl ester carboxylesterase
MVKINRLDRTFSMLGYELPGLVLMPESPKMGFVLWLYGSNSNKEKHLSILQQIAEQLNLPVFCFDYSGHGDAPFTLGEITPAQHFLEVITVYDSLCAEFGCGGGVVIGGSYGAYLLLQLLKYRKVVAGILRCPYLIRPSSFYTRWENRGEGENDLFQVPLETLDEHPLLARASTNQAPMLVLQHGEDEEIPVEIPQTIAKKLAHSDLMVVDGIEHSLRSATEDQVAAYEELIISWLKKQLPNH